MQCPQFQHVHFIVRNPDRWLDLQVDESAGLRCTCLHRRVRYACAGSARVQCLRVPAKSCVPVA
jgi:hypothetical protein